MLGINYFLFWCLCFSQVPVVVGYLMRTSIFSRILDMQLHPLSPHIQPGWSSCLMSHLSAHRDSQPSWTPLLERTVSQKTLWTSALNRLNFTLQKSKADVLLNSFLISPRIENSIMLWLPCPPTTTSPTSPSLFSTSRSSSAQPLAGSLTSCVRKFPTLQELPRTSSSQLCWVSSWHPAS